MVNEGAGEETGVEALRQALRPLGKVRRLIGHFYEDDGRFAGTTFLGLEPNTYDRIEAEDLLAVTFMGETYPPYAVRRLLNGHLGSQVGDLLRQIPANVPLWEMSSEDLRGTPTAAWWVLLEGLRGYGVGPTRVSKLLARKRPALIPIYDSVIGAHVAPVGSYWDVFYGFLSDEVNRSQVDALRPSHFSNIGLPTLRLLDTAVWMRYSKGRSATDARAKAGL